VSTPRRSCPPFYLSCPSNHIGLDRGDVVIILLKIHNANSEILTSGLYGFIETCEGSRGQRKLQLATEMKAQLPRLLASEGDDAAVPLVGGRGVLPLLRFLVYSLCSAV
jgi:hypothetical protein